MMTMALMTIFIHDDINRSALAKARSAKCFGVILGTLGRQGSQHIYNRIQSLLAAHDRTVIPFLMAEINPAKLAMVTNVEVRTFSA